MKRVLTSYRHLSMVGRLSALALGLCLLLGLGHVAGTQYAKARPGASCPFGGGQASWNVATMPWEQAPARRGVGMASDLGLLTLRLAATNRAQLLDWARGHGCTVRAGSSPLECVCPAPASLGPAYAAARSSTAFFQLDRNDVLRDVTLQSAFVDARAAQLAFEESRVAWHEQFGPISAEVGAPAATFVAGALLRQSRVEFHRENVLATLSATNFGDHYNLVQTLHSP